MNAGIYKLIFSKRLNTLVVVGEICSSQGKAPGTTRALKRSTKGMVQVMRILAMFSSGGLLVSTAWATPAVDALPTGGQVVQGAASISQSGAQMDINQASQRAVINWQTFDVGSNAKVQIIQPNQAAVLLNRVVTNKPSEIYGKIDANGQVILVNNNGIIFGKDGSASASSFTASTLDINDQDFMDGKDRYSSNGTQGEIVNHGTIEAKNGGYVALLGAKVTNDGKIITHNGTVALGAADSIAIPMTSSGKIKMQLSAGSINAALENTKNAVIVTEGGDVYLQAAAVNSAMASIKHSGQIDTSGDQAGKAVLLADNGEITVDGSITANSTNANHKGGDIIIGRDTETGVLAKTTDVSGASLESKKGFVETSAHQLKVNGIKVKAKEWLLDPDNIEITNGTAAATYTAIATSTITSVLAMGTDVTIDTTAPGTTIGGVNINNGSGISAGNILVTDAINATNTTNTDATLTLNANNGIKVNNSITGSTASGSLGKINVTMTALGTAGDADSGVKFTGNGNVDITGNLQVNGTNTGDKAGVSIMPAGTTPLTLKAAGNITLTGKNTKAAIAGVAGGADQAGIQIDAGTDANAAAYGAVTNITSGGVLTLDGSTVAGLRAIAMGGTGASFTAVQKLVGDGYTINLNSVGDLIVNAKNENKSAAVAGSSTAAIHTNIFSVLNATSSNGAIMLLGDKAISGGNAANSGGAVNLSGNVTFNSLNGTTIAGKTDTSTGGQGVLISRGSNTNATAQAIDVTKGDLTIYGAGSNGVGVGYYKAPTWSTTPAQTAAPELVGTKITANSVAGQNVTISGLGSSGYGVQAYGTALSNTANATGTLIDAKGDVNINGYVQSASGNIALNLNSGAIKGANVYIAGSTSSLTANAVTFGSGTRNVLNQGTTYAYQTNNKVAVTATNQLKIQGAEKSVAATLINGGLFSIDTAIVTPAITPSLVSFATSVGGVGIGLDAGSSWTAANIQAAGKTGSYNGVLLGAGSSITTTGNSGDSKISAIASATSGGGAGAFQIGYGVNLKAANGSTLTLDGQATGTAATVSSGVRGMRIDGGIGVDGNIAINGTSNSSDGLLVINGVIAGKANSLLTLYGKTSGNGGAGSGVYTVNSGGVTLANGASVSITGKAENQGTPTGQEFGVSLSGAGITQATGATTAGDITITGSTTSTNNAGAVSISAPPITTSNSGNIVINGTALQGPAIQIASTAILQAANVTLTGTSTSGAGVNGTGKITATTGNVQIDGLTTTGGTGGHVMTNNNITANSGDIVINGTTATTDTPGVYINTGNTLSAKNILVTGTSTGLGGVTQNAKGIRSWGILNATDKITLTGTSTNVTGIGIEGGSVTAGGAVVIKQIGTSLNYQGVNIGAAVKGASVSITGSSRDHLGVAIGAAVTATSGDVNIKGTSGINQGIAVNPTGSVKSDQGNITIEGISNSGMGVFIGTNLGTTNIDAKKNVTITGTSTTNTNTGVSLGAQNGNYAFIATIKSGGDTTVNGTGLNGVKIWEASSITADNINITGNAVTTGASAVGNGVDFQRFSAVATLTATKDINIEGTVSGQGTGSGIKTSWSGQNGNGPVMNAGGNFTLRGNNRAAASNTQAALYAESGMQVTAGKNIVVQAETNNNQANAMSFWSTVDMYRGNASFVSTGGDVLIQANQGGISFNNQQPSAVGQLTDIKGRNITIDNTGAGMATGAYAVGAGVAGSGGTKGAAIGSGSIDTITGAITAGTGKATGTNGVLINDGRKLTADNNISITGVSSAGAGAGVYNNNGVITATTGKVAINGNAQGASGTAIYSTGAITGGSVYMNGSASGTGYGVITSSTGTVKSTVSDVWIEGLSQKGHGVYLQSTIDATATNIANGSSGITIKGSNNATGAYYGVYAGKAITAKSGAINITGTSYGTSDGVKLSSLAPITAEKDQVSIIGKALGTAASTASGVYSFAAIKGTSVSIEGESKATGTGAYYGVLGAGTIDATADYVNIKGTSATANSFAVYLQNTIKANGVNNQDGSAVNISGAGNSAGSAVYMEPTTAITNYSTGGTTNIKATQGNISFIGASSITNETNAGAINVIAGDGTASSNSKIVADAGSIITQKSNAGINMTTDGTGNLTVAKIINNGSGDVNIGAGKMLAAGNGAGGQVRTVAGNSVANNGGGKLFVYSGSATGTGTLANLDSTNFAELYLDNSTSGHAQNAESNVAYGATIGGSGAVSQVMFREKVSVNIQDKLNGATFNSTYGDTNTKNGQNAALLSDVQGVLKVANSSSGISNQLTSTMNDANGQAIKFHVSASTVIDNMDGAIQSAAYSTADYLKANTSGYIYDTTNSKYTVNFATADSVKVVVDKLTLTGVTIDAAGHTYGGTVAAGTVNFSGSTLKSGDLVDGTASVQSTAGDFSTSNNLKAGSYDQKVTTVTSGNANNDADNYTFNAVTNASSYTVAKKAITTAGIAAVTDAVYGIAKPTGAVTLGTDVMTGDLVSASNTATVKDGVNSTSGNLKAGDYKQTVAGGLSSYDAGNYDFSGVTTSTANYHVDKLALTGVTIDAAGHTYGGTVAAGTVNFSGSTLKSGDLVGGTASVQSTASHFSTSNNLKAGSYDQKFTTVTSGNANNDADNYTFNAVTNASSYTVAKKTITTAGIAAVTDAVYGTARPTGAVTLGMDVMTGDLVSASNTATVKDGVNSTSGNLKAGDYKQTVAGGLSSYDAGNYDFSGVTTSTANYHVSQKNLTISADGKTVVFNNTEQSDTFNLDGIIRDDVIRVTGAGKGTAVGSYMSHLDANGDDIGNYNVHLIDKSFVIADAAKTNATTGTDPLLNPVPVNPNYKTPDNMGGASELVTTQHNNDQIQKQCSLEFSKECKAQPTLIQDYAPRYTTFY